MALITRSEAAYRLKIISAKINNAVSGCREGSWKGAAQQAQEAMEELEKLLPHLEEAADTDNSFAIFQAEPVRRAESGGGGMGYRGSRHKEKKPNVAPPKPIDVVFTPPPRDKFPPQASRGPIITPPPPPPIPTPQPIITPAPAPRPQVTVSQVPVEPDEEILFDLSRIDGQDEQIKAAWGYPPAPVLTEDEWRVTKIFDRLPEKLRIAIARQYRDTKRPVKVTITSAIRKEMI